MSLATHWLCVLGQISLPLWAKKRGEIRGQQTVANSGPLPLFVKKVLLQHSHTLLFMNYL